MSRKKELSTGQEITVVDRNPRGAYVPVKATRTLGALSLVSLGAAAITGWWAVAAVGAVLGGISIFRYFRTLPKLVNEAIQERLHHKAIQDIRNGRSFDYRYLTVDAIWERVSVKEFNKVMPAIKAAKIRPWSLLGKREIVIIPSQEKANPLEGDSYYAFRITDIRKPLEIIRVRETTDFILWKKAVANAKNI